MSNVTEWLGLTMYACVEDDIGEKVAMLNSNSLESDWIDALKELDEVCQYYCSIGYLCYGDKITSFPSSKWTILHHMAYYKAPLNVVKKFLDHGFCVGLKDGEGKLALDHVASDCSQEYRRCFIPQYQYTDIDFEKLNSLQVQFHKFMMERLDEFRFKEDELVLPDLKTYLEKQCSKEIHLEIPGMLGGFNTSFIFSEDNKDIIGLNSYSLSRVCGGSDKEHKITKDGWEFIKGGDYI